MVRPSWFSPNLAKGVLASTTYKSLFNKSVNTTQNWSISVPAPVGNSGVQGPLLGVGDSFQWKREQRSAIVTLLVLGVVRLTAIGTREHQQLSPSSAHHWGLCGWKTISVEAIPIVTKGFVLHSPNMDCVSLQFVYWRSNSIACSCVFLERMWNLYCIYFELNDSFWFTSLLSKA